MVMGYCVQVEMFDMFMEYIDKVNYKCMCFYLISFVRYKFFYIEYFMYLFYLCFYCFVFLIDELLY